jgi:cyanophycinase
MKKIIIALITVASAINVFAQKPIEIRPSETRHGPEKGSLVIIGGHSTSNSEIWDKIIELSGGKEKARWVVVTNATGDDSDTLRSGSIDTLSVRLGAKNVTRLHLKNIREANDEKNLNALREATGVFFDGGRQWRIADVYLNTLAHQEFLNLLNRDGVIAGTSAGASIQGSFLWRGDTSGHKVLIGDHTQGLGFLRNSAIDQHLLVRNRQNDLSDFIKIAPQFIGVGLDESTAVVIQKDELEVIGKSYVAIYTPEKEDYIFLQKGDKYDLKERKISHSITNLFKL